MALEDLSDEEFMDRHALLCEKFSVDLETIDEDGGALGLDTHGVIAHDFKLFGQQITTLGVGLMDARPVIAHARGERLLDDAARRRGAVLLVISNLLTEVYQDDGYIARSGLRGSGIQVPGAEPMAPGCSLGNLLMTGIQIFIFGWLKFFRNCDSI